MKKQIVVFDIEVLRNVFLVCCLNSITRTITRFEISERRNDLEKMVRFFKNENYVFSGYNSIHYDSPIVTHLIRNSNRLKGKPYSLVTEECFSISKSILNSAGFPFPELKKNTPFVQIDLMTMMASKALRVGLKSLQVTMCYKNVQEMGVNWEEDLPVSRIDELIGYCDNDIGSTAELLYLLKKDISLRLQIQKKYNIECLSKDGVGIGVDIFTKFVCEKLGITKWDLKNYVKVPDRIIIKDLIQPCIKFKTKPFQDLLSWYNSLVISLKDFEDEESKRRRAASRIRTWEDYVEEESKLKYKRNVVCNNLMHTFALGGVHSVNKPTVYVAENGYILRDEDVDVAS